MTLHKLYDDTIAETTDVRLSEHFPKVPPGCEQVAETFFNCFSAAGRPTEANIRDPRRGIDALRTCRLSLLAYNACVDAKLKHKDVKVFRVPEVYRTRPTEGV